MEHVCLVIKAFNTWYLTQTGGKKTQLEAHKSPSHRAAANHRRTMPEAHLFSQIIGAGGSELQYGQTAFLNGGEPLEVLTAEKF